LGRVAPRLAQRRIAGRAGTRVRDMGARRRGAIELVATPPAPIARHPANGSWRVLQRLFAALIQ